MKFKNEVTSLLLLKGMINEYSLAVNLNIEEGQSLY